MGAASLPPSLPASQELNDRQRVRKKKEEEGRGEELSGSIDKTIKCTVCPPWSLTSAGSDCALVLAIIGQFGHSGHHFIAVCDAMRWEM